MTNYIDREAFIEWLKTIPLKDLSDGLGLCRVIMEEDFKRCIKNIPQSALIDAIPVVHGRWIETIKNGKMKRITSCCGDDQTKLTSWYRPNYCPNCGARMDGDE